MGCKVQFKVSAQGHALQKTIEKISKSHVEVGFNEKSGSYGNGLSVAQVAMWNEYGTSRMCSRPFMRKTMYRTDEIRKIYLDVAKKMMTEGYKVKDVYTEIGQKVRERMQYEMLYGTYIPLSPITIARKGHDQPLIDTGKMYDGIRYEVKNGN